MGLSDSRGAFFGAAFVRRVDGRFHLGPLLGFSASRIHVRSMSIRISRTRAFGACAAIRLAFSRADSASFRSKHGSPQKGPLAFISKQNPAETGEEPAGFQALGTVSTCQVSP